MKNIFISSLLFLTLGMGLSSCSKFLAENSQDQLTPTQTIDFLEMLNGGGYPDAESGNAMQKGLIFMDDDIQMVNLNKAFASNNTPENWNAINAYKILFTWQPNWYDKIADLSSQVGDKTGYNSWARYYSLILQTNIALDYADGSVGTVVEKNYLKGQAYGLRAYYYFMLVNFYGWPYNAQGKTPETSLGVPLILTSSNKGNIYKPRNTVKEVYTQITSDLDSAILYLEKDKTKASKKYRMNHLAAHLLASRVYLYMENWPEVIKHSTVVINEKGEGSLLNLSVRLTQVVSNTGGNAIVGPNASETLWTFGGSSDYGSITNQSQIFCLSDSLIKCYSNTDLRMKGTFIDSIPKVDINKYAYVYRTNKQYSANGIATMKAFRVAEAYLNRAEAYLQSDNDQGGLDDLNTLRSKRYSSYTNWTISDIDNSQKRLDSCRMERRRELFLEDHRWFDLRRYGMPEIKHTYYIKTTGTEVYTTSPNMYVWPIPSEVIERNNLIRQN